MGSICKKRNNFAWFNFFNSILFSNFFFMSFDVGTDYTDSKKDDVQKLMLEFKYLPTRLAKILKSLLQRHTY